MTTDRHIVFVTGRLAAPALERVVAQLAESLRFGHTIVTMPITVAALMTTDWIARRLRLPPSATEVILPGYCRGELETLSQQCRVPVERGPRDLLDLPEHLGAAKSSAREGYGDYSIEIIAEVNHAPELTLDALVATARQLRADGADVIDLGCNPGEVWGQVGEAVRTLRDAGLRVSIDSFEPREIGPAVQAGAELVLSVNSSNRDRAVEWDAELVVIPDQPSTLEGLDTTIELLLRAGKRIRVDAILEPIGFGFAESLMRYAELRRRYPELPMMMGVGNLTELTDCDSAGLNLMLAAICEELGIDRVLTTQVISWARTSVRELDLARRLVHHAVTRRVVPKRVDSRLVILRDVRSTAMDSASIAELAVSLKDNNFRLFVAGGELHLVAAGLHLRGRDPHELFAQLMAREPPNLDASHAFYLGYELAKAKTALTLGKQFRQDEALDWGFLTEPESWHRNRKREMRPSEGDAESED